MRRIALRCVGGSPPLTLTISVLVLGVAGCGGGDDSSSTTTQDSSSTTTQAATETLTPDPTDFLGAVLAATTAGEPGVVVLTVAPDSLSRLKRGDVIVACNGEPVAGPDELVDCAGSPGINDQFTIRVVRGSHRFTLTEVLSPSAYLGAEVKDATGGTKGAVVVSIAPDSPAAETDLQKGDVISAIDETPVHDSDSLLEAIGSYVPGDEVMVSVNRGSEQLELTATLAPRAEPRDDS